MFRPQYILVFIFVLVSGILFSGQTQLPALPDSRSVISYLNESISWYRHFSVEQQLATEPRDVLFVNENRQLADQIIRLSFDFAKAEALSVEPVTVEQNRNQTASSIEKRTQSLQMMTAKADELAKQRQREVDSLKDELHVAKGKSRDFLRGRVAQAQSELEMAETHRATLHTMVEFARTAGEGTEGNTFRAQIEQLERTVPAVNAPNNERDHRGEQWTGAQSTSAAVSQKERSACTPVFARL